VTPTAYWTYGKKNGGLNATSAADTTSAKAKCA
jgi:hypothetical protein